MAANSEISEGELKREEESDDLFEFGDDLELNQFDGLPYSSRYYRLLQERKTLPVWKYRHEFRTLLDNNQIIIVSGTTKTGQSTQVSFETYACLFIKFLPLFDVGKMPDRCLMYLVGVNLAVPSYLEHAIDLPAVEMHLRFEENLNKVCKYSLCFNFSTLIMLEKH